MLRLRPRPSRSVRRPGSRRIRRWLGAAAAILATALLAPPTGRAAPPDEGECPTLEATPEEIRNGMDATALAVKEGMTIDQEKLLVLHRLLPPEIWRHREVFFFEGMRMRVGYCHRRYLDAPFYRKASRKFRGKPTLDEQGNLVDYTAGIPFWPEDIDPQGKQGGLQWAWNMEMRYRGAGHRGKFRLVDMPSGLGREIEYYGRWFFVQTRHRADLPDHEYMIKNAHQKRFAAGGEFDKPFDQRYLAWRQFRPEESAEDHEEPDDIFVYVPSMRKSRRSATNWVDGLFFPRYSASGDAGGGGIQMGGNLGGGVSSINPTAGQSIAATEDARRGLTGISIRPNAYVWRVRREQDVLAPLNANRKGYPIEDDLNFGPSGLSVASDVWDVRRAVILEGLLRVPGEDVKSIVIYLDYQTRVPLYWITRTHRKRFLEIGILVHRYTSDVSGYEDWPGGFPANVFEPVASVFYNALEGRGGWRRESYDISSLPFSSSRLRQMISSDALDHGH